jgi:CheY-like chemotaxis protein
MAKKLNCILLVDDDDGTNFLHRLIIKQAGCSDKVEVVLNGEEALHYLAEAAGGNKPVPELIFLDINMPLLNGWEFLDEYAKLGADKKVDTKIIMLTTSVNPDDARRAGTYESVAGFKSKPLEEDMLNEIIAQYFPA